MKLISQILRTDLANFFLVQTEAELTDRKEGCSYNNKAFVLPSGQQMKALINGTCVAHIL